MKRLLNLTLTIAALSLLVMVGSSRAQTSSPQLIELESGETTKVATGIATQGSIKVYLLQNNAAEKKNVKIRLTPADHTRFGVYDQNDVMINEDAGSNVFDADLAEGGKIKLEIWAVRAPRIQFTLVITVGQTSKSSGVEMRKPAAAGDTTIPNPHRHARGDDMLSAVAPEIKIVEANASDYYKDNWVENKAKTFSAFTTATEEGIERIFFEDLRVHRTYEIQGAAWPNRPLNDPACVNNYFIFDRSVNPRRSIHYAFDLDKKIIVAARAF